MVPPSASRSDSVILPRSRRLRKMFSAGGQVPTQTLAPASASALAIAKPKPPSSATPAMKARLPERLMGSMGGTPGNGEWAMGKGSISRKTTSGEVGAATLQTPPRLPATDLHGPRTLPLPGRAPGPSPPDPGRLPGPARWKLGHPGDRPLRPASDPAGPPRRRRALSGLVARRIENRLWRRAGRQVGALRDERGRRAAKAPHPGFRGQRSPQLVARRNPDSVRVFA